MSVQILPNTTSKVADIALVSEREHPGQPSLVHVRLADIVMRRASQPAHLGARSCRILSGDGEQGALRRLGAAIDQVADLTVIQRRWPSEGRR